MSPIAARTSPEELDTAHRRAVRLANQVTASGKIVNKKLFLCALPILSGFAGAAICICKVGEMRCGNGAERTQHPCETWGDDWAETALDSESTKIPAPSGQKSEN
jgi:hypothetical protein